eukprot:evm.model.scf_748.7 EVM.evm.TU.scf_748.7   scf_748:62394-62771(-)
MLFTMQPCVTPQRRARVNPLLHLRKKRDHSDCLSGVSAVCLERGTLCTCCSVYCHFLVLLCSVVQAETSKYCNTLYRWFEQRVLCTQMREDLHLQQRQHSSGDTHTSATDVVIDLVAVILAYSTA